MEMHESDCSHRCVGGRAQRTFSHSVPSVRRRREGLKMKKIHMYLYVLQSLSNYAA